MITNLGVRNFRSLKDASLELRTRNVLIGANKSGKTTLLDALRFLQKAITAADVTLPLNERGGMERIRWQGSWMFSTRWDNLSLRWNSNWMER